MNTTTIEPKSKNYAQFRFSTQIFSEIIIFVALAGALAYISHSFFSLPEGGSINIGMVPIFWLALRRGTIVGVFSGAVLGVADLAIEPFVVHPIQLVLDYPLAFACLGLAGFFRNFKVVGPVIGVFIGGTARFLCHFTSGVVYFPMYAPEGMNVIVYSAIYNATYMIPSIIICAIVVALMQKSHIIDLYK